MAILPIDPISGKGWKNSDNASHLLNATGDDLRRCLEDLSYLYDEIVFNTRYHASHYTLMSDSFNGLVQVLETSAKYFTYSATTTQSISLNNTPSYFMAFFDPTFAVISGNPDTIPRTLMHIPSNAGFVFLYLRVSIGQTRPLGLLISVVLAGVSHEPQHREKSLQGSHELQLRQVYQQPCSQVCGLPVLLEQSHGLPGVLGLRSVPGLCTGI